MINQIDPVNRIIIHVDCEEYKLLRGRNLCLFLFVSPLVKSMAPQVLSIE